MNNKKLKNPGANTLIHERKVKWKRAQMKLSRIQKKVQRNYTYNFYAFFWLV